MKIRNRIAESYDIYKIFYSKPGEEWELLKTTDDPDVAQMYKNKGYKIERNLDGWHSYLKDNLNEVNITRNFFRNNRLFEAVYRINEATYDQIAKVLGNACKASVRLGKLDVQAFQTARNLIANSTASTEGIEGVKDNSAVAEAFKRVIYGAQAYGFKNPKSMHDWLLQNKDQITKILGPGALEGVQARDEQDAAAENNQQISLNQAFAKVRAQS